LPALLRTEPRQNTSLLADLRLDTHLKWLTAFDEYQESYHVGTAAAVRPLQELPALLNAPPISETGEMMRADRPIASPILQTAGDTSAVSSSKFKLDDILLLVIIILAAAVLLTYLANKHTESSTSIQDTETDRQPDILSLIPTIPSALPRRRRLPRNWDATNSRRAELIKKKIYSELSQEEGEELAKLQAYTAGIVKKLDPFPRAPIEDMKRVLRRPKDGKTKPNDMR
jgi:hypothetical protein